MTIYTSEQLRAMCANGESKTDWARIDATPDDEIDDSDVPEGFWDNAVAIERNDGGRKFRVAWSDEDGEYVGTCDDFPSLSFLHADEGAALDGIVGLVRNIDL